MWFDHAELGSEALGPAGGLGMTEGEWRECSDPAVALYYMPGWPSARKLRLFACACCRQLPGLYGNKHLVEAIEVVERYADGRADADELANAESGASPWDGRRWDAPSAAVRGAANSDARMAASGASGECASAIANTAASRPDLSRFDPSSPWIQIRATERRKQTVLLFDLLGNPFHRVVVDPAWLLWRGGTISQLARCIYEERRFSDLPLLADMLTDAGCDDAEILEHCHSGGEHVLGCWVVDLLLGKP
jgi:hypothetical protein